VFSLIFLASPHSPFWGFAMSGSLKTLLGLLSFSLCTIFLDDLIYSYCLNHHLNTDDPALVNILWVSKDRSSTQNDSLIKEENLLVFILEVYVGLDLCQVWLLVCSNHSIQGPTFLSTSGAQHLHSHLAIWVFFPSPRKDSDWFTIKPITVVSGKGSDWPCPGHISTSVAAGERAY
jgi:hypothetical protein